MRGKFDASKIIFIGGAPRSGTTLVQRVVASNSCVYGGPEFDLVPNIVELRNKFKSAIDSGRISKYFSHGEVDDLFRQFIVLAFSYKLNSLGDKYFVSEKTPSNVAVFPELAEIFPDSSLVFVIRDPRAVISSMLAVGNRYKKEGKIAPRFTRNIRDSIDYVNVLWAAGRRVVGKHRRLCVVYYEDLINNPIPSIKKLADELGIAFENSMYQIKEYDSPELKGEGAFWYNKERLSDPIQKDSLEKWHDHINNYQRYIISKRVAAIPEIERYNLFCAGRFHYSLMEKTGYLVWRIGKVFRRITLRISKSVNERLA